MKSSTKVPSTFWTRFDEVYRQKILPTTKNFRGFTRIALFTRKKALESASEKTDSGYKVRVADREIVFKNLDDFSQIVTEKEALEEILTYLQNQNITSFVDCGAYHGFYSKIINELTDAKIYAFEMEKESYEDLKQNFGDKNRLQLENKAVWSENTELKIEGSSNVDSFASEGGNDVKAISLDSYFEAKKVDLIKIDVEGAELKVLEGARNTLQEHKPDLILEIHKGEIKEPFSHDVEEIYTYLEELGYRFQKIEDKNDRELLLVTSV